MPSVAPRRPVPCSPADRRPPASTSASRRGRWRRADHRSRSRIGPTSARAGRRLAADAASFSAQLRHSSRRAAAPRPGHGRSCANCSASESFVDECSEAMPHAHASSVRGPWRRQGRSSRAGPDAAPRRVIHLQAAAERRASPRPVGSSAAAAAGDAHRQRDGGHAAPRRRAGSPSSARAHALARESDPPSSSAGTRIELRRPSGVRWPAPRPRMPRRRRSGSSRAS